MNENQYIANLNAIKAFVEVKLLEVDSTVYITNKEARAMLEVGSATLSKLADKYKLKDPKIKGHACYIKSKVLDLQKTKESNKIQFKES